MLTNYKLIIDIINGEVDFKTLGNNRRNNKKVALVAVMKDKYNYFYIDRKLQYDREIRAQFLEGKQNLVASDYKIALKNNVKDSYKKSYGAMQSSDFANKLIYLIKHYEKQDEEKLNQIIDDLNRHTSLFSEDGVAVLVLELPKSLQENYEKLYTEVLQANIEKDNKLKQKLISKLKLYSKSELTYDINDDMDFFE